MENTEKISCYHRIALKKANKTVQELVSKGLLSLSSGCGLCDHRVPGEQGLAVGQDVSCVGPRNPLCPHPSSATVLLDNRKKAVEKKNGRPHI